ncbi:hypothetical protein AGMMS49949_02570 [Alphaproteobacteria bacterium]|nr:hypothetical protein AGMMS49949_02570 [Alphaproteobacteria bacterium]GHS95860.1 hypothetical protein AGMMS50296_1200 [Alphaproteobacteria bacterium]
MRNFLKNKRTKGAATFAVACLVGVCFFETGCAKKTPAFKVCINKIVDHEALNETARGIQETLQAEFQKLNIPLDVKIESAQGNAATAQQITDKFVSQKADFIVGIGTLAAQSFLRCAQNGKTRFVFSSVTDPKAAGLLSNTTSIIGVSNFIALEPQIDLFVEIQPGLKRLGFLYNPSEANSITLLRRLEPILAKRGIQLVPQVAAKMLDVPAAVSNLAKKVDVLFISNDNTALSALPSIISMANKSKTPVYVSDTDIVPKGAVAALGPNQYQIGVQTAKLILKQRLSATNLATRVEYPQETLLVLNQKAAKTCALTFPDALLKRAQKVLP